MFLKCIKVLAKGLMHLLFRFEMDDALVDKKGPFIICANHRSNWDAFAMFLASPMDTYIVGKKELSDIPIIGAFLRAIQMIPVYERWRCLFGTESQSAGVLSLSGIRLSLSQHLPCDFA